MKTKEIKNMAKKIAQAEWTIQHSDDPSAVRKAQDKIIELSGHVENLEDITLIDEFVQDMLKDLAKKNS